LEPNLQIIMQQLQSEKSIDRDTLIEAIQVALETAARKSFSPTANITVEVDPGSLHFKVFEIKTVVNAVEDHATEVTVEEAKALNPEAKAGDRLKVLTEPRDFGRIAAQTAKQVILQKIKDAEREHVFEEYKKREGELITGIVKRVSHGNVIVSVGRAEAILPHREQSPRENYKPGDRIRAFLIEVERSPKGTQLILSRGSAELVRALFELEVPEIFDGTIEIRGIAREAGSRTKIAVLSHEGNVDAVGACVGMKGSRVRAVVDELGGEKIDIVRWSDDPVEMCGNALNPADIIDITVDENNKVILVVVPHDQLSLAIGKRGQNARLASRLMGWNIDIKSDIQLTAGDDPAEPDATSAPEPAEAPLASGAEEAPLVPAAEGVPLMPEVAEAASVPETEEASLVREVVEAVPASEITPLPEAGEGEDESPDRAVDDEVAGQAPDAPSDDPQGDPPPESRDDNAISGAE
jgi:transcription termination/antitermination protein NusA